MYSIVFTILTSSAQIYREYRKDVRNIENVMLLIQESYLESLRTSLWSFDLTQLEAQVAGMVNLPFIKKVVVYELLKGEENPVMSRGAIPDRVYREYSFILYYNSGNSPQKIGRLVVFAGLDESRAQIKSKVYTTIFFKLFEIIILSFFVLMVFYHAIIKHLDRIQRFFRDVEIKNLKRKLVLDRRVGGKPDILDGIVKAINTIIDRLALELSRLKDAEARLTQANLDLVKSQNRLKDQEKLRIGQVDVNEILRGDLQIRELADRLTAYLCRRFNAGVGIFYFVDDMNEKVTAAGSFAFRLSLATPLAFDLGEGQTGQIAKTGKMALLNINLPEKLNIQSSLGQTPPRQVLIYPFVRDGHVSAVLEVGSAEKIHPEMIELLKQISESVAIATDSAVVRTQKTRLGQEIQNKSKELEEREQYLEEREYILRILFNRSERFLVLTDREGRIRDMNKSFRTFAGIRLHQVKNDNLWDAPWWDDPKKVEENTRGYLAGDDQTQKWRQTYSVKDKSGSFTDVLFISMAIRGASGSFHGILLEGSPV